MNKIAITFSHLFNILGTESMDNAKRRLRVAFEFFSKLGVKYWTFHDRFVEVIYQQLKL